MHLTDPFAPNPCRRIASPPRTGRATTALLLVWLVVTGGATPALAMHDEASAELDNLRHRIEVLEQRLATVDETPAMLEILGKTTTFSGLLEIEGAYSRHAAGSNNSDLTLATVQLGIEVQAQEQVGAHLVLLHEEGGDEVLAVDEAVIALNAPREFLGGRLSLAAGKQYLPFGAFHSHLLSDPLTLELGETSDTALCLHWTRLERAELRLAVFNGQTDRVDQDDTLDSWVASLTVHPMSGFAVGASFLSDLAESDLGLAQADPLLGNLHNDDIPAISAFISLTRGPLTLEGEYLAALARFDPALVALGGDLTGRRPRVWNAELALTPAEGWELAARLEGARDFRADPTRYGGAVAHEICPRTVLALEYLRSAEGDAGDAPVHTVTAQLAMGF